MKKKRIVAALLAIMLLSATALTACDKKADEPAGVGNASVTIGDDGREMKGNLYLEGLPVVKEQETFTFLIDDVTDPAKIQELEMIKQITEDTNVKVDFLVYPNAVAVEKKNTMLNTGDYPDVMGGWLIGAGDVVKFGTTEKIFIPLEELFAEYAPNVEEALALPGIKQNMTLPDGHIYSPPYPVPEPELIFAPYINQVWLDNLDLEMPTTTEQFYDVLKAFKEQDANGNGDPNDEIPISAQSTRLGNWFALFGYPVIDTTMLVDGDKLVVPAVEPSYKEAIKFFNKLYEEQLLDQEVFSREHDSFFPQGKGVDSTFGAAILYNPSDMSPGLGEDGLFVRGTDYVPLPPLTNPQGQKPVYARGSTGTTTFVSQLVVTDAAKNPETIVRWIDHVYNKEISTQIQFGKFDVTLTDNGDGTYTPMEKTDITGAPGYVQFLSAIPRFPRPDLFAKVTNEPSQQAMRDAEDNMDEVWKDNLSTKIPTVWRTAEESKELSVIETDLNNHIKKTRAEWITGTADVEADWDAYLKQMDDFGLQKYIEINTKQINAALGK